MENSTQKTHNIPASLARLFQEYDFNCMDACSHANTIIERTLEMGTWEELHWLFHHYGIQRVIEYIQKHGHRRLSKMAFNYWCKLLKIKEYRRAPFGEIREDVWRT
jgi:hypothetical protein